MYEAITKAYDYNNRRKKTNEIVIYYKCVAFTR